MKKFILAIIVILTFTSTVNAAEIRIQSAHINDNTNILSISGGVTDANTDQNISITVSPLKDGRYDIENVVYVGQQAISENFFTLSFPIELNEGYYVARIGGNDIATPKYLLIEHEGSEYSIKPGDVNADGVITSADSALTLQYVLNKASVNFSELQIYLSNVSGDKEITAEDAALILSKVLNGMFPFRVEEYGYE